MSNTLRAIEFLGLSIWLGSDVFLSFVVAPGAFSVLASRNEAGAIVGYSLGRMHWMGILCGGVRGVDDSFDGDFAGRGQSQDGGIAGADGLDPGDRGG